MATVFLSHASEDKPFVHKLAEQLSDYGLDVWMDEAEIGIGDSLLGKISSAIDSIDFLIGIISRHSVCSKWVEQELEIAMANQIELGITKVLPVLMEPVTLPASLSYLKSKRHCDLSDPQKYDREFSILLRTMGITARIFPTADNLSRFRFVDLVIAAQSIYALAFIKTGTNHFLINPHGAKTFEQHCYIIHVDASGNLKSTRIAGNLCADHGTLEVTDNQVHAFINYKLENGSFGMSGSFIALDRKDLSVKYVRELIAQDNWGFFPIIERADTVRHFCFNNYVECLNEVKLDKIHPQEFEKKYRNNVSKHSNGLLPSANGRIAEFILDDMQAKKAADS